MPDIWRQEMCSKLEVAIKDEEDAIQLYTEMQVTFEYADNPGYRAIGWSGIEQLKKDEQKHRDILEHVRRMVCATGV
jgi:rubrerythrin